MAFVTKSVILSETVRSKFTPSGSTVATSHTAIAAVNEKKVGVQLTTVCSGSAGATKSTAFNTLIDTSLKAAIDAYIQAHVAGAGLGLDAVARTLSYQFTVTNIERGESDTDYLLSDANCNYRITGDLKVTID